METLSPHYTEFVKRVHKKESSEDWNHAFELMKDERIVQVDEEFYYECLGVLPPKTQKGSYFEMGEIYTYHNNKPVYFCFWEKNGKYYGCLTTSKPEKL